MKIDNIYLSKIYDIVEMSWDHKYYPTLKVKLQRETLTYIKVDKDKNEHYIDLVTGSEYYTYEQLKDHEDVNSIVDIQRYPTLEQILGTKKKNMSKRRILKMYKENNNN